MKTAEPMTTFTLDEWRAYKRAVRQLKYVQRRRQGKEADPVAYLEALRREHDPYEHDLYEQEDYHYDEATYARSRRLI